MPSPDHPGSRPTTRTRRAFGPDPDSPLDPAIVATVLAGLPLRDYQREAAEHALARVGERDRVQITALPTGAGKTLVGAAVAAVLTAIGYRVLWLAPRWDHLAGAADAFHTLAPEKRPRILRVGGTGTVLRGLPEGPGG